MVNLLAQQVKEGIADRLAADYYAAQIGIVLMNHGCPEEAGGYVTGVRESQGLYDRVRDRLVNRFPLVSVGWLNHNTPLVEWTQPEADRAAKNLIELGAKAIVFVPIGFATDNHETILDVNAIVERLQQEHPHVALERMNCVNDHPQFLQMVANWAHPEIDALLDESGPETSALTSRTGQSTSA